jgi:peptidylprolyl isomerase
MTDHSARHRADPPTRPARVMSIAGLATIFGALAVAFAAAQSAPPLRIEPVGGTTAKKAAPAKTVPAKAAPKAPAKAVAKAAPKTAPKTAPNTAAKAAPKAAPKTATPAAAVWGPAPKAAPKAAATGGPSLSDAPALTAGPDWRPLEADNAILFETTKGRVVVELAPEIAPGHVARVKELARAGFYDGLAFHRVIEGFMAQGGDPKGDGTGGSDKPDLKAEFNFRRGAETGFVRAVERGGASIGWLRTVPVTSQIDALLDRTADRKVSAWANHCPGVASMARSNAEDSANSQFFLIRSAYPSLDRRYTIWGRAVLGLDVIRALKVGEPVVDPDRMTRVRVLADVPEAERPSIMIQRTDGPAFQARLRQVMDTRGAAFSNCDVAPEVRLAQ